MQDKERKMGVLRADGPVGAMCGKMQISTARRCRELRRYIKIRFALFCREGVSKVTSRAYQGHIKSAPKGDAFDGAMRLKGEGKSAPKGAPMVAPWAKIPHPIQ